MELKPSCTCPRGPFSDPHCPVHGIGGMIAKD